jgi:hypothetical protein
MHILFLTQSGLLGPSSRYRVYQLLPELARLGINATVSPAMDDATYSGIYRQGGGTWQKAAALRRGWQTRQADLRRLDQFDCVVSQNGFLPGIATVECAFACRKPLIFDFDDAIYLPRVGGNRLLRALHSESKVQQILACAAHVTAGNNVLATYARQFNPNVTIVPSSIDLGKYSSLTEHTEITENLPHMTDASDCRNHDHPRSSAISAVHFPDPPSVSPVNSVRDLSVASRIGWIGSASTLPYLKPLKPVFDALQVKPIVIAAGDPSILGYPVDFRPWTMETEMDNLRAIGVGLAPLPDTPWENGKCGVKLLQYMACGIPAVASPVGVHKDIIEHGVNGFLATTTNEWIGYLRQLMDNANLRCHLGQAARRTVEERYDVTSAAKQVAEVLQKMTTDH